MSLLFRAEQLQDDAQAELPRDQLKKLGGLSDEVRERLDRVSRQQTTLLKTSTAKTLLMHLHFAYLHLIFSCNSALFAVLQFTHSPLRAKM